LVGRLLLIDQGYLHYNIRERNPVPASGLWSGSGSKVNQFVHVPTSVNTQNFIQIHACVFE